jgi:hypothetical protein
MENEISDFWSKLKSDFYLTDDGFYFDNGHYWLKYNDGWYIHEPPDPSKLIGELQPIPKEWIIDIGIGLRSPSKYMIRVCTSLR